MPGAVEGGARGDLLSRVVDFGALLRAEHGFSIGPGEMRDALRAVEAVGLDDPERVRSALRLVLCGSPADVAVFDRAFDAFFHGRREGRPQTRRPAAAAPAGAASREKERELASACRPAGGSEGSSVNESETAAVAEARPEGEAGEPSVRVLAARYSPAASGAPAPPRIDRESRNALLAAAGRLASGVWLGTARRWRTQPRGPRFDLRRTLRASLGSGGDPILLKRLGHPLRNPRFALFIDGSRSMAQHAATMLAFAQALTRRTSRARVFLFSTELREVTRELRSLDGEGRLEDLGEAWGGGTRIGASLQAFVRGAGGTALSDDTLAVVFSDGLDAGDVDQLRAAMRAIARRAAGVVWLNPHAGLPGYEPTARAMQAALPYVGLLAPATDLGSFEALAKRLSGRLWAVAGRPLRRARPP